MFQSNCEQENQDHVYKLLLRNKLYSGQVCLEFSNKFSIFKANSFEKKFAFPKFKTTRSCECVLSCVSILMTAFTQWEKYDVELLFRWRLLNTTLSNLFVANEIDVNNFFALLNYLDCLIWSGYFIKICLL